MRAQEGVVRGRIPSCIERKFPHTTSNIWKKSLQLFDSQEEGQHFLNICALHWAKKVSLDYLLGFFRCK